MSSYRISYEQLRQSPNMAEMLDALERGFQQFGIDYYLVGAVARDAWMSGIHQLKQSRTTDDIDFAVLINDKGIYEALRSYLITQEGFTPVHDNSFVLLWRDGKEVDLMPFGAVEDEDAKVTVSGTGYTSIHVPGYKEVYATGLPELELSETHRFKLCTLPGIVLLKLIAWDDRPEKRRDDILDISDILKHFFTMNDEQIWSEHSDLFGDEEMELEQIAAIVLGRQMAAIASPNESLYKRVMAILETNTTNASDSRMAAIMAPYFGNTVEDNVKLLRHIQSGLKLMQ